MKKSLILTSLVVAAAAFVNTASAESYEDQISSMLKGTWKGSAVFYDADPLGTFPESVDITLRIDRVKLTKLGRSVHDYAPMGKISIKSGNHVRSSSLRRITAYDVYDDEGKRAPHETQVIVNATDFAIIFSPGIPLKGDSVSLALLKQTDFTGSIQKQ